MLDFLSSDKESDDDTVSDPIAYDPNESFTSKEMTSDIDYGKDRAAWLAKTKADLQETSGLDKSKPEYAFAVNFLQILTGVSGYNIARLTTGVQRAVAEVIGTSSKQIIVEPGVENEKWREAGHIAMMIQVLSNNSEEADMILATIPLPLFTTTMRKQLHEQGFSDVDIHSTVKPRLEKHRLDYSEGFDGGEYNSEMDITLEGDHSDALESGETGDNVSELIRSKEFTNVPTPRRAPSRMFGDTFKIKYEPQANDSFVVEGSNRTVSAMIDGVYVQQPPMKNQTDYPTFVRLSMQAERDPMVMWFYPKRRCWMLGPRTTVGTDDARAIVKCNVKHPYEILKCLPKPTWFDWHMETQGFQPSPHFTFRLAQPNEIQHFRPDKVQVTGRVGYNRAMNGVYTRGKKPHRGKFYYKHAEQDFKIRWFQNVHKPGGKWVIDWRVGLEDDNVGAAVIKEDQPEPWMCATGWRVYDARIKQKNKWIIDRGVKISPYRGADGGGLFD